MTNGLAFRNAITLGAAALACLGAFGALLLCWPEGGVSRDGTYMAFGAWILGGRGAALSAWTPIALVLVGDLSGLLPFLTMFVDEHVSRRRTAWDVASAVTCCLALTATGSTALCMFYASRAGVFYQEWDAYNGMALATLAAQGLLAVGVGLSFRRGEPLRGGQRRHAAQGMARA